MNHYEYTALMDKSLPHDALALYVRWFRRRMNYQTGLVETSLPRMISTLDYNPAQQSRDKHYEASIQRVRTLIRHLEGAGLIQQVTKGDVKKHQAAVYICVMATTDETKSTPTRNNPTTARPVEETPTTHQHDSNTQSQHAQQHAGSPEQQGLALDEQHAHQHVNEGSHQHYTDGSDKRDIYTPEAQKKKVTPKQPTKRFKKPTPEQVEDYLKELDQSGAFTGQEFVDKYEGIGWVVGKNKTPMKNWKAVVRTWLQNRDRSNQQQNQHPKGQRYARPTQASGVNNLINFSQRHGAQ